MRIRVLHFDGCPHSEATLDAVRRIAAQHRPAPEIEMVEVRSLEEAIELRFFGSPTVQVDGVDIDPAASDRTDFGLTCRLYGRTGVPPAEMIVAAIRNAPA